MIACGLILLVGALLSQNLINEARTSEEAARAEISEQQRLTEDREEQVGQTEELLLGSEKVRSELTEAPEKQQGE